MIARSIRTPKCTRWCAGNSAAASTPTDRKAFLFTNVTDSKGRKFDMPVLVCGLAGNNQIYSLGMGCKIESGPSRMTAK